LERGTTAGAEAKAGGRGATLLGGSRSTYERPAALRLVGDEVEVPGPAGLQPYVDFDSAASTPALAAVHDAVEALLPWYSSVRRGCGYKSQLASAALEGARGAVAEFIGARDEDVVVFVRNTTEAINLVARGLAPDARVLVTGFEHHANLLPWRSHPCEVLPFSRSSTDLLALAEAALARGRGAIRLFAISAASNVTGEVVPVAELAALGHRYGAWVLVDAAQLVPHRPVSMRALDADFLAFSGHKLYAPYGVGALVASREALAMIPPLLQGGGAVKYVTLSKAVLADLPARHEAGSPNLLGAVALGAACDVLRGIGMERIAEAERALAAELFGGLETIAGLRLLRMWPSGSCEVLGVASFVLDGLSPRLVAAVLAWEYGIGVRCGSFCAHPLLARLLGLDESETEAIAADLAAGRKRRFPGAVRASIGLGTTVGHVQRLVGALRTIASEGPRVQYVYNEGANEFRPANGNQRWPNLPFRLGASA